MIPAGSIVSGVVVGAHSAGKFKGAATLSLKLVSVNVHGRSYPSRPRPLARKPRAKASERGRWWVVAPRVVRSSAALPAAAKAR